ncbi:hypothetical protein MtrunA17_Chr3g0110421 [Medicago truncatula]|uniref:Uncharacterized protein n=1 Tax=Medicago truncatula TaxID=3880 RepID=A0A396IU14_MEDTR|nr:hypothetical protein MtrunA17_Chr3g0110421 [Medicago truncatula]
MQINCDTMKLCKMVEHELLHGTNNKIVPVAFEFSIILNHLNNGYRAIYTIIRISRTCISIHDF